MLGIEALDRIGVLHRNISLYNIVLVGDGTSGVRRGYIIDFENAIRTDLPEQKNVAKEERMVGVIAFRTGKALTRTRGRCHSWLSMS